ncbi:MAG: hypothetical protein R2712_25495 [Vicinamibacterales bacterium]
MARIVLVDRGPDDAVPDLVVHLTDAALTPVKTIKVDDKGAVELKEEAVAKAAYVAIAAAGDGREALSREHVVLLRSRDVLDALKGSGVIELLRPRWERIIGIRRCVSGRVRACRWWWPWRLEASLNLPARATLREAAADTIASGAASARLRPELELLFPRRCAPVCEGVVEVYQRICCWTPIVILDPRIDELLEILDRIPLPWPPPDPWPGPDPGPGPWPGPDPGPGPDPAPWLAGGVPDEVRLNAVRDRTALRALPAAERPAYINARPYLHRLWSCGTPRLVASGFLQPDGEFQICWRALPVILAPNCRLQVAYVVKQLVDGVTVTIYDGRAAGQWFGPGETPTLTTYDRRAVTCRGGGGPEVPGASVFLELIGDTESHQLESPVPNAPNTVSATAFNSGLLFPAATPAAAKGQLLNCNLGGTLNLLYRFSEGLRAVGAKYYRLTVQPTDMAGVPVGAPTRIGPAGSRWRKFRFVGGGIQVVSVPLAAGPVASGEPDLWTIPFDGDLPNNEEWLANQYHGQLATTAFGNGRHLLSVEIFNAAGQRLRPAGAGGAGTDAAFHYHLWEKIGGTDTFTSVPFAGLTHMLWWDNRTGTGDIEGVQVAGSPVPVGTCLFLSGPGTADLLVRHRAYHPQEMFLHRYALTCFRGLEGAVHNPPAISNGVLPVADATANAGEPPAAAALSTGVSFATLLGPHRRCSFAVNLTLSLKTTNGSGFLHQGSLRDTVAFALEQV